VCSKGHGCSRSASRRVLPGRARGWEARAAAKRAAKIKGGHASATLGQRSARLRRLRHLSQEPPCSQHLPFQQHEHLDRAFTSARGRRGCVCGAGHVPAPLRCNAASVPRPPAERQICARQARPFQFCASRRAFTQRPRASSHQHPELTPRCVRSCVSTSEGRRSVVSRGAASIARRRACCGLVSVPRSRSRAGAKAQEQRRGASTSGGKTPARCASCMTREA
jgi:hypothetical protein